MPIMGKPSKLLREWCRDGRDTLDRLVGVAMVRQLKGAQVNEWERRAQSQRDACLQACGHLDNSLRFRLVELFEFATASVSRAARAWQMSALELASSQLDPGRLSQAARAGITALESHAAALDRKSLPKAPVKSSPKAQVPSSRIISGRVAVERYHVSSKTLLRRIQEKKLTDHRPKGHKKNAALQLDEAEVAAKFERKLGQSKVTRGQIEDNRATTRPTP